MRNNRPRSDGGSLEINYRHASVAGAAQETLNFSDAFVAGESVVKFKDTKLKVSKVINQFNAINKTS
jgi:hypothetical protein